MNGPDKSKTSPDGKQLRALAMRLISEQSTMTVATARGDTPWAAPVYYTHIGFRFYYFSDPSSRHVQEAASGGLASAAIYRSASTWKDICGIQMSGRFKQVPAGLEAARAIRSYVRKFPFTMEFFAAGQKADLDAFVKRFRVRLYRLEPTLLYYLDNHIRFGFREMVPMGEGEEEP